MEDPADPFDPKQLELSEEIVRANDSAPSAKGKSRTSLQTRPLGAFVQVPLPWFYQALSVLKTASEVAALVRLLHLLWAKRSPTARFAHNTKLTSHDMRECGVTTSVRNRLLRRLEEAGLATIIRQRGASPEVTLFVDREPNKGGSPSLESALAKLPPRPGVGCNKDFDVWRPADMLTTLQRPDGVAGAWPNTPQQLTALLRRSRPGSVRIRAGRTWIVLERLPSSDMVGSSN
jgi:hypothetical protein